MTAIALINYINNTEYNESVDARYQRVNEFINCPAKRPDVHKDLIKAFGLTDVFPLNLFPCSNTTSRKVAAMASLYFDSVPQPLVESRAGVTFHEKGRLIVLQPGEKFIPKLMQLAQKYGMNEGYYMGERVSLEFLQLCGRDHGK